ncbi:MAG: efflux RND transporter periplasmic adaptor subunit [Candidatus Binatia bacterium]
MGELPMRESLRKSLPFLVIAGGLVAAVVLVSTRPEPARTTPALEAVPVRVLTVASGRERVVLPAMGTVMAATQIALQPEVAGRIVEMSPNLVPGGRIAEGELLARIDPRDYEHAVEQRLADAERARFELRVEASRARIAEREWELLGGSVATTEEGRSLALREPHLRNLRAALDAAESALGKARLDLERTRLVAPFNAIVQEESADVGQIVSPQSRIATLVGSDQFWVRVSLPVEELRWVRFPQGESRGSAATIVHETGSGAAIRRPGRVIRLFGDLEPKGRLARLLVAVDDPMNLRGEGSPLPLFIGAYVRTEIEGPELDAVFEIPREAVRDGGEVWVMDAEDRLEIRPVEIAFRSPETVLVNGGLRDGERVVTSRIATPLPRMALRILEERADTAVAEAPEASR